MLKDHVIIEHDHDHEHETRELTDDELAQVSGGAKGPTTCPCRRHQPLEPDTM